MYVVPRDRLISLSLFIIPDITIFSFCRSPLIPFFKLLGSKIVIHENEGIPYSFNHLLHSFSFLNQLCTDAIWLWGNSQLSHLLQSKLLYKSTLTKLIVSGGIRYEYFKSLPHSDHTVQYQVNTNFPMLSPKYNTFYDELLMHHRKHPKVANEVINSIPIQAGKRERLISFASSLSSSTPIRFRPHPFESTKYYSHIFPFYSLSENAFEFVVDTDIHDDLSSASLCFNNGCQTTLDCLLRGVIPVSIEPSNNIWSKYAFDFDSALELSKESPIYIYNHLMTHSLELGIDNILSNFIDDISVPSLINPLYFRSLIRRSIAKFGLALFRPFLLRVLNRRSASRLTQEALAKSVKLVESILSRRGFPVQKPSISTDSSTPFLIH